VTLGAAVLDALVERTGIDGAMVDDVIVGCVCQSGPQAGNVGRNMVLASSKLPITVPGTAIDRQCGSSLQVRGRSSLAATHCISLHPVEISLKVVFLSLSDRRRSCAANQSIVSYGPLYPRRDLIYLNQSTLPMLQTNSNYQLPAQAIHFAAQAVMSGTNDVVIAAGVESMSMVPIGSNITDPYKFKQRALPHDGLKDKYPGRPFSQFAG
jgi:acetyl-CoA acetyltransferase